AATAGADRRHDRSITERREPRAAACSRRGALFQAPAGARKKNFSRATIANRQEIPPGALSYRKVRTFQGEKGVLCSNHQEMVNKTPSKTGGNKNENRSGMRQWQGRSADRQGGPGPGAGCDRGGPGREPDRGLSGHSEGSV